MTTISAAPGYRMLDVQSVKPVLGEVETVKSVLGGDASKWSVSEIGDGNLNFVFRVDGPNGSIIAKQALPWIRARGEKWKLPLTRAYFEKEALVRQASRAPKLVPAVIHYDDALALLIMECLSPHIILRKGLVQGRRYPRLANDLGKFLAHTLYKGSRYGLSPAAFAADESLFSGNQALCDVTLARVFTEPYVDAELNRWTSPQLDNAVLDIRADKAFTTGIAEMKRIFISKSESLIHGDLHSGSVMVTEDDTRVIDPEFAFCGPMSFDIGALFANYFIAYLARPEHASEENSQGDYGEWILSIVSGTWQTFDAEFRNLCESTQHDVSVNSVLGDCFNESMGFAAAKMMRRVIGAAHVEDLESIADPDKRARRERQVMRLSRALMLGRRQFQSIDDPIALARDNLQH